MPTTRLLNTTVRNTRRTVPRVNVRILTIIHRMLIILIIQRNSRNTRINSTRHSRTLLRHVIRLTTRPTVTRVTYRMSQHLSQPIMYLTTIGHTRVNVTCQAPVRLRRRVQVTLRYALSAPNRLLGTQRLMFTNGHHLTRVQLVSNGRHQHVVKHHRTGHQLKRLNRAAPLPRGREPPYTGPEHETTPHRCIGLRSDHRHISILLHHNPTNTGTRRHVNLIMLFPMLSRHVLTGTNRILIKRGRRLLIYKHLRRRPMTILIRRTAGHLHNFSHLSAGLGVRTVNGRHLGLRTHRTTLNRRHTILLGAQGKVHQDTRTTRRRDLTTGHTTLNTTSMRRITRLHRLKRNGITLVNHRYVNRADAIRGRQGLTLLTRHIGHHRLNLKMRHTMLNQ